MDETNLSRSRKLRAGLVCMAVTCLAAMAMLWVSDFTSPQRMVLKHPAETRAHRDPLKVLLRGILL